MFEKTYTVFVDNKNVGETDSMASAIRLGKALGQPFYASGPPEEETFVPDLNSSDGASIRFSLLELS